MSSLGEATRKFCAAADDAAEPLELVHFVLTEA